MLQERGPTMQMPDKMWELTVRRERRADDPSCMPKVKLNLIAQRSSAWRQECHRIRDSVGRPSTFRFLTLTPHASPLLQKREALHFGAVQSSCSSRSRSTGAGRHDLGMIFAFRLCPAGKTRTG